MYTKAIRDLVNPNQQVISFSTNFVIFLTQKKGGKFWEKMYKSRVK
jgi:hypothetical protein